MSPAPARRAIDTYGSNICTTSTSPLRNALRFVAHGAICDTINAPRIDAPLAQVVLQAEPWGRHLRHGCNLQPWQISQIEAGTFALADQKERIACGNLAETDKRRGGIEVARFHHPHRSTPRNVDRSVEQTGGSRGRRRRVEQIYDDALAGIETEHVRGVEWRIKQSTKVFREPDPHRGNLVHRHTPVVSLSTNLCR